MLSARQDWAARRVDISGYPHLVSDAGIIAGSPTLRGTRIETSIIAAFAAPEKTYDADTVASVRATYPRLTGDAIEDALRFEGLRKRVA